jgi:eukaryotic-like serine/threonine-protein kinase
MSNRAGQQFGNYRLIRLLGQGGFADVYLAEHIHLETLSAVKILSIRLTSEHVEHFRTEARTVARLIHPHIVRVLDFGVEDSTPYLAMDYAPNGSLRQYYAKGTRVPLNSIVGYVKQVAEALQYAHDHKLIHRDVKPDNMLIGAKNEILLSDFGIASLAHSTHSLNTQEGSGTIYYMAPEQIQGKPRIASDQYALGIVVYEWISGVRPFNGTAAEIGMQQLLTQPPSLREKVPTIPADIEQVVFTALAKDPQKRFASVQAFATALEKASQITPTRPMTAPSELLSPNQPMSPTGTIVASPSGQLSEPPNAAASLIEPSIATNLSNSENVPPLPKTQRNSATTSNHQGFHIRRTALLIGLALLIIASGIGLFTVIHPNQLATFNATATALAQASAHADATPAKTTTPTRTATSIPDPTPTASATNTEPYPPGAWKLALYDPLSQPNYWNNGSNPSFGGSCQFINGAYHISQSKFGNFFCAPPTITFSNLTVEVKMSIIKGGCGGIWFRGNGPAYFFSVCQDGQYGLYLYASSGEQVLVSGSSAAIQAGTNQSNLIAVVANGSDFDMYANYQKIKSISNSVLSSGEINFAAVDTGSGPTEVAYSDARVWTP